MSDTSSKSEIRRGWPIILACACGVGLGTTGLAFYSMTLFIGPLMHAFGWSRTAVSAASFCLLGGTILTSPFVGRLIERFGALRLALISQLAVGVGFAALSLNTGSLPAYYLTWLFISFFGTGTTPIVWTRTVNLWFRTHLGLALAITLCGTGVVAMIAPSLLNMAMTIVGWRGAYLCMSAVLIFVGMPSVYFLLRGRTELPSTEANTVELRATQPRYGSSPVATLNDALRTATLWKMAVGIALASLVIAGLAVHMVPIMVDAGLSRPAAAANMGVMGLSIIIGRLSIGGLLDRLAPRFVSCGALLLPGVSCLIMANHLPPVAGVIALGLSAGAEVDLLAFLVRRYFGIKPYAAVYGFLISCFSLGASVGPLFAGWLRDASGSYTSALYAGAATAVVSALLFGMLARLQHRGKKHSAVAAL